MVKIYGATELKTYCTRCSHVEADTVEKCPNVECESDQVELVVGAIECDSASGEFRGEQAHYFKHVPDISAIIEKRGFEPLNPKNGLILRKTERCASMYGYA